MSRGRRSQVGFRDDTSYLTAHYGGRRPAAPDGGNGPTSSSISTPRTPRHTRPTANPNDCLPSGRRNTGDVGAVEDGAGGKRGEKRGQPPCKTRGTLSEQLASIGKAAEDITAGIRQAYGLKPMQGAVLTTPSESFLVGKLRCKYPSPVHFFGHKCVYVFHHPFEAARITMEMFFRDMRVATLDAPRRQLRFKIDHPLCHYDKDYAHDDPSHFVVIEFSSGLDTQRVDQEIMPLIRGSSR